MKQKRYTTEQIIRILRQSDSGQTIESICREQKSFHSRLRDECLDREVLFNVREAQVVLEDFRQQYNWHRPHSKLSYKSPEVFILDNFNQNLSYNVA